MGGLATTPQQSNGLQVKGMIGPDGVQQDVNIASTLPHITDNVGGSLPYEHLEKMETAQILPHMESNFKPLPYGKLESPTQRMTRQQQAYQKQFAKEDAPSAAYAAGLKRHQEMVQPVTADVYQKTWSQGNYGTMNDQDGGSTNNYGREFSKPASQEDVIEMEIRKAEQQYQ
jgi:hypothetical protein